MTEPSSYFRQHHAVEAPSIGDREFRPGWRIRPKLEQLFMDKAISFVVFRAGAEFRALAEIALSKQYPAHWLGERGDKGRGSDRPIGRIHVGDRLDAIRKKLGVRKYRLLERHLVLDLDWVELGRRYRVHAKTIRRRTIAALGELATVIWQGERP